MTSQVDLDDMHFADDGEEIWGSGDPADVSDAESVEYIPTSRINTRGGNVSSPLVTEIAPPFSSQGMQALYGAKPSGDFDQLIPANSDITNTIVLNRNVIGAPIHADDVYERFVMFGTQYFQHLNMLAHNDFSA